jgi:hypothetical protein
METYYTSWKIEMAEYERMQSYLFGRKKVEVAFGLVGPAPVGSLGLTVFWTG